MKILNAVARHLSYVGITILSFLTLNWVNELVFSRLDESHGITWIFIPAGIRLLSTLLFGVAGLEGLLLTGIYLNFEHFHFHSDYRAWTGAVSGALGPYLASLFAKHWFDLRARLQGLTPQRLVFTGVLCGFMSPIFHHAFMWVLTGDVDLTALTAMIVGDTSGILIVLSLAKGAIVLSDRHDAVGRLMRHLTSWRSRFVSFE